MRRIRWESREGNKKPATICTDRIRTAAAGLAAISLSVAGLWLLAAPRVLLGSQDDGLRRAQHAVLAPAASLQGEMASELEAYDALLQRIRARAASGGIYSCEAGRPCFQWLDRMTGQDGFKAVLVADAAGNLIYASPNLKAGVQSVANEEYFARWAESSDDGIFVGPSDLSVVLDGAASMSMSRPMRNARGEFIGVVAGVVPLTSLASLRNAQRGAHLTTTLLTADGTLIGRDPPAEVGLTSEDHRVIECARILPSGFFAVQEPPAGTLRIHGFYAVGGFPLVLDVSESWPDR